MSKLGNKLIVLCGYRLADAYSTGREERSPFYDAKT